MSSLAHFVQTNNYAHRQQQDAAVIAMLKFVSTRVILKFTRVNMSILINVQLQLSTVKLQSDTRVLLQSHEAANTGSSRCDDECLPDIVCAALGVGQEKEGDWKNPQLCERGQNSKRFGLVRTGAAWLQSSELLCHFHWLKLATRSSSRKHLGAQSAADYLFTHQNKNIIAHCFSQCTEPP